jgi:dinuclear metal center YbgI/SA1388 family protein
MTVNDILSRLDVLAPLAMAESNDNVGLLIGDPAQPVRTIMLALDATPAVLRQVETHGAELLITHHPLLYAGFKQLVEDHGVSSLARALIQGGRSLICLHTNLDSAPEGLNTYVARLLGMADLRPLLPLAARPLLKLVVYVPETHVEAVRAALCAAGAGRIGRYGECTFGAPGVGTFRADAGTQPFIGAPGTLERVPEIRLETVVPKAALDAVLAALFAHHPYEEVAYDLFTLDNPWPHAGLGRIGRLASPVTVEEFLARVSTVLQTDRLMYIGDRQRSVQNVALCTGGGGSLIDHALRARVDLYLSAEFHQHHALLARQHGMAVIDAGHYPTERPAVPLLADYLTKQFSELTILQAEEEDPLQRG